MKKLNIVLITWMASLNLWLAIRKANKAYALAEMNNQKDKRYYVMPDENDKLIVLCRDEFRKLKKYKRMDEKARVVHLIRESFYYTPYSGGDKAIDPAVKKQKRLMYIRYCLYTKGAL